MDQNSSQLPPILVGMSEATRRLGIGRTTTYGLIASGALHPIRIVRRVLFHVAELDTLARRWADDAGVPGDILSAPQVGRSEP